MKKKDSGATFIFALFCVGGIFALLSQTGVSETSAQRGSLNPGATSTLRSDFSDRMLDASKRLDAKPASGAQQRCCRKGPLFD